MEMILLIGQGHAAMGPDQATLPNPEPISLPAIPRYFVEAVFILQLLTIILVILIASSDLDGHMYEARVRISHIFWILSLAFASGSWSGVHETLFSPTLDATRSRPSRERYCMIAANGFLLLLVSLAVCLTLMAPIFLGSWYSVVCLPYYLYSVVLLSSRMFLVWAGEQGKGWYLATARPSARWDLNYSTLTYAGGLLVFYISVFNPESTWKASWTEYLP